MPGHKNSWILVKGCEYNPNRSLSLGQILTDPFQPSLPLLPDGPLPVPKDIVEFSYQDGVVHSYGHLLDTSFRIWADADLAPVTAELGSSRTTSNSLSWNFDRLEGQIFIPRIPYVTEALQSDSVVSQIKRSMFNFRKRLYIVTGVRIARGARMSDQRSCASGFNASLGVDGTAYGVPATLGVDGGFSRASDTTNSFQGASDFVYAYRLWLSTVDYDGDGKLRQVERPGTDDEDYYLPM
ncbi:hypothetical protein AUP68_12407 [Ilyonectria robusta]